MMSVEVRLLPEIFVLLAYKVRRYSTYKEVLYDALASRSLQGRITHFDVPTPYVAELVQSLPRDRAHMHVAHCTSRYYNQSRVYIIIISLADVLILSFSRSRIYSTQRLQYEFITVKNTHVFFFLLLLLLLYIHVLRCTRRI